VPEGAGNDYFVYSVAVHDGTVVVGSKSGETRLFVDADAAGNQKCHVYGQKRHQLHFYQYLWPDHLKFKCNHE